MCLKREGRLWGWGGPLASIRFFAQAEDKLCIWSFHGSRQLHNWPYYLFLHYSDPKRLHDNPTTLIRRRLLLRYESLGKSNHSFFFYFLQLIRLLDSLFRTACPSFSFIQFIYFFWCSKNAPGTKSTTMNLPHKAWTTLITEAIDWHDRSIKFALKEIGYLVVIAIR